MLELFGALNQFRGALQVIGIDGAPRVHLRSWGDASLLLMEAEKRIGGLPGFSPVPKAIGGEFQFAGVIFEYPPIEPNPVWPRRYVVDSRVYGRS